MLMWRQHRSFYDTEQTRSAPGNSGRDGSADARDPGASPWVRDREAHRTGQREPGSVESGDDLRFTRAFAAARLDLREVGDVREQPEGEVLLNHQAGVQTARGRRRVLAAAGGRDGSRVRFIHGGLKLMISIRELLARLSSFISKRELDREFDAELAAHLEIPIEDNLKQGLSAEEARRRAMISLGGMDASRELHRESRGLPALETILQDIRYSFRTLRRDAGLATFAILIIGLGVGASSTVFSVVNALLLRPLPFESPGRLAWIANSTVEGLSGATIQVAYLQDLRAQSQSFSDVAGYFAFYGVGGDKLTAAGEPERLTGVPVSENFFQLLGVRPQLGRLFTAEECRWNGPQAVLLSHRLWERRFASDPSVVGRAITLNDAPVTVVGVLPASFDFATVFAPGSRVDLYRPFPLSDETNRWGNTMALIGRLKPGVTSGAAQAEVAALAERTNRANPNINTFVPRLSPLRERVSGQLRSAMFVLACAVGLVMMIVCANLSNLLLARAVTREKEIAIR